MAGPIDAILAPIKWATALIGDIPGARKPDNPACTAVSVVSASTSNVPASISISQEQHSRSSLHAAPVKQELSTSPRGIASPSVSERACIVQTRAASARMKRLHPLVFPNLQPLKITPADFAR